MPLLKLLRYYLWIAPHLFQIGIAMVMFRRRLIGLFPWFFAYTCFEVGEFILLFSAEAFDVGSNIPYRSMYAVTAIISTVLRFGIILEILRQLTSNYVVLARVLKPLFRWMTVGLLIAALGFAVYAGGNHTSQSWFAINVLERTVLILQTGILVGLFLFSRYLTLSWRNHAFGIALGLGIFATVDLITAAISAQAGYWQAELLDYISMAAYHCSTLIWLFYLLRREPVRTDDVHNIPVQHEVEAWNEELDRLLHQR
jgi:hypothetical protein